MIDHAALREKVGKQIYLHYGTGKSFYDMADAAIATISNDIRAEALEEAAHRAKTLRWQPKPGAKNADVIIKITSDWGDKIAAAIRALINKES